MLVKISEDENHNKIAKPIAGATLGQGVPLGTWCSFEKDVAPSNNWLMAGSSISSDYPALALYLGTNQVPYRYDHNRPSDWEDITLSTDSNNPTVMEYDGVYKISAYCQGNNVKIYVNGEISVISTTGSGSTGASDTVTIPVKKGDLLYRVKDNSNPYTVYKESVQYYTHPLFIKATSIASDSDKDSILAQIQAYNTYSTEETLTGKTWIDGKPIYRKCFYSATNWSNGTVLVTDATIERCIKLSSFADNGSGMFFENLNDGSNIGNCWHNVTDNTIRVTRQGAFANSNPSWVIIEYTKTTD